MKPRIALASVLLAAPAAAQISFDPAISVPVGQRPSGVAAGDVTGDGVMDLVVTTDLPDKVEVLSGAGGCALTPFAVVPLGFGTSPDAVATGDFNGDGLVDVAVTLKNVNQLQVLVNSGGGLLVPGATAATGFDPRYLAVGDIDGDGDLDFATSNRDGNDVTILRNDAGAPTFLASLPSGVRPQGVVLRDFTGDGLVDLAVASHDTFEIQVRVNLGGGTFGGPTSLFLGVKPSGITAADIDLDGDLDILAAASTGGLNMLSWFLNAGTGAFGPVASVPTGGLNPDSVVAADFDGDGAVDAAVTNQDSNQLSVFQGMSGGFLFGAPTLYATGTRPGELVATDVGGDGSIDVVTSNRDSNSLSLFCGHGGGTTTYCVGAPNTFGAGSVIGSLGTLSVAANSFVLTADGAVPNQAGLFFYGSLEIQLPFGDGFRCVGGSFFRLNPPVFAGPTGSVVRAVDFTQQPAASGPGQIAAGSTWKFQYWYRDPASTGTGGAGFNLSNALSATFQP